MSSGVIRILSDLHYGDLGGRVRTLAMLRPLFDGADALVLNGDTLDTRPGPDPAGTAALRAEVLDFFRRSAPPTTLLTGNHDPDISDQHTLDLANGQVLLMHGDVIFDDLVPWSQDAPIIRQRLAEQLGPLTPADREHLDPRSVVYRRVAASIPQRHQSERNGLKHAWGYIQDTVWPPMRVLRILGAWHRAPRLTAALTRRSRPQAKYAIIGHIHRPGSWRHANGVTVLNTGSFGPPLGGCVVDVLPDGLRQRRIIPRAGEFHLGKTIAEFPLG